MKPWWITFSQELKASAIFAPERITPRALSARFYAKRAISILDGDASHIEVVGYEALWPTKDPRWYEFDIMKAANAEIRRELYDGLATLVSWAPQDKRMFLVTDDPLLMCKAARCGFAAVTKRAMPEPLKWASRVHAVRKLPPSVHESGHPAPGDGRKWLFVR